MKESDLVSGPRQLGDLKQRDEIRREMGLRQRER